MKKSMMPTSAMPCLVVLLLLACEPQAHDPGGSVVPGALPAEATVKSLRVFPGERREGLRKVEVTVTVATNEAAERTVIIVEWVPVVLLRRLAVGASVALTPDPLEKGRLTLAL
jgi:hypothetical protein